MVPSDGIFCRYLQQAAVPSDRMFRGKKSSMEIKAMKKTSIEKQFYIKTISHTHTSTHTHTHAYTQGSFQGHYKTSGKQTSNTVTTTNNSSNTTTITTDKETVGLLWCWVEYLTEQALLTCVQMSVCTCNKYTYIDKADKKRERYFFLF